MITADTITDEQIRELRSALHEAGHTDTTYIRACDLALKVPECVDGSPCSPCDFYCYGASGMSGLCNNGIRNHARARCAEILNARSRG